MLDPASGVEIGRRLKFNTKTALSDEPFASYAGLLQVGTGEIKSVRTNLSGVLHGWRSCKGEDGCCVSLCSLVSICPPPSGAKLMSKGGHVWWVCLAQTCVAQSRVAQSRVAQGCQGLGEAVFLLGVRTFLPQRLSSASRAPSLALPACMLSEA